MFSKTELDQSIRVTLNTADPDGLVTADNYPAGELPLNGALIGGGRYATTTPQYLLITTAADESANTFTFTGKDLSGATYTYSVFGPDNTTLVVPVPFSSIEENGITISADAAGDISIGITTEGATPWCEVDCWRTFFKPGVLVYVEANSTLNYTVQYTNQNPFKGVVPTRIINESTLTSQTATGFAAISAGVGYARLQINSFTSGAAWFELRQPCARDSKTPANRTSNI